MVKSLWIKRFFGERSFLTISTSQILIYSYLAFCAAQLAVGFLFMLLGGANGFLMDVCRQKQANLTICHQFVLFNISSFVFAIGVFFLPVLYLSLRGKGLLRLRGFDFNKVKSLMAVVVIFCSASFGVNTYTIFQVMGNIASHYCILSLVLFLVGALDTRKLGES